ncbi:MAG TPA: hypothetical protein VFB20_17555 [Burkholderiales bacterium]|nr:hypothetical protein [Burkholderiales bacterium]
MQPLRRAGALAAMVSDLIAPSLVHAAEIALNADQMRALGITVAKVESAAGAPLAGLAAMVAIPHSQQQIVAAPLPGSARGEAAAVRRMSGEVAAMHASAQDAYAAWLRARDTAEGMRRHAQTTMRAYELKEAGLAGVVAALAALEAAESRYRLLIEAHLLWRDPTERDD